MASGKVKWWDRRRGYGFIVEESGQDVFVHYSVIQGEGYKALEAGEAVEFESIQTLKGLKAQKVERLPPLDFQV